MSRKLDPKLRALFAREVAAQRTEEWFKLRKGMLTASDAASAIGKNPYKSREALLKQKLGLYPQADVSGSCAATDWGTRLEDEVSTSNIKCGRA